MRSLGLVLVLAACGSRLEPVKFHVVASDTCAAIGPVDRTEVWLTTFDGTRTELGLHDTLDLPEQVTGAQLEVRQFAGGEIAAWGRSTVLGDRPEQVTVVVRRSNAFTCSNMRRPRAGHTATTLLDGTVFVAGGYTLDAPGQRSALVDTELFVPAREAFDVGPAMTVASIAAPRAFHSANLLPNGQVLLWGGERYTPDGALQRIPLVYDALSGAYGALPLSGNVMARSRHAAVSTPRGVVVLGGSRENGLEPALQIEDFEAASNAVRVATQAMLQATNPAGAFVPGPRVVAVVSGAQLSLLNVTPAVIEQVTLTQARSAAHVFARENDVVVVGEGTSEIFHSDTHVLESGPPAPLALRDGCSAPMGEGRWFYAGGGTAAGGMKWDPATGQYVALAFEPLPKAVFGPTCTALHDGSVMVSGGVDAAGDLSAEAWVFTPALE